jgi:hypothetical protein
MRRGRVQRSNAKPEWSRNDTGRELQATLHANDEIDGVKTATALFPERRRNFILSVSSAGGP